MDALHAYVQPHVRPPARLNSGLGTYCMQESCCGYCRCCLLLLVHISLSGPGLGCCPPYFWATDREKVPVLTLLLGGREIDFAWSVWREGLDGRRLSNHAARYDTVLYIPYMPASYLLTYQGPPYIPVPRSRTIHSNLNRPATQTDNQQTPHTRGHRPTTG